MHECTYSPGPVVYFIDCDWILENLPFWHKQYFEKTQLKIFIMLFKLIFLHIWLKQLLNLLAHTKSFFFSEDDDYI